MFSKLRYSSTTRSLPGNARRNVISSLILPCRTWGLSPAPSTRHAEGRMSGGESKNIGGVRYWWLVDDAMISMRYARNLAEGSGLVWNVGERVEGYTNLLWTLFMSLVHLTPLPDSKTSLVVLLANVAIGAATVPLIVRLVRLLDGGAWVCAATVAAYVLGVDTLVYGTNGLEATLFGLFLVFCVCRVLEEARSGSPRVATYLAIGIMGLVRADAAVLSGLICGASLVLNKDRRTVVYYCLVAFMP